MRTRSAESECGASNSRAACTPLNSNCAVAASEPGTTLTLPRAARQVSAAALAVALIASPEISAATSSLDSDTSRRSP